MTFREWIDHVQSVVSGPSASEFRDPLEKTFLIPTVVVDDFTAKHLDLLSETCLAIEGLIGELFKQSDQVTFGEPFWAEWPCVKPTT